MVNLLKENNFTMDETPHLFVFKNFLSNFEMNMDEYLTAKHPDCNLYSEDGTKFQVHKEIFSQTRFMRDILANNNEYCCEDIEIFCPCNREELSNLVHFLYVGQIYCDSEFEPEGIFENLHKIFGFPDDLTITGMP